MKVDYTNYGKEEEISLAKIKDDVELGRLKNIERYAKGKLVDIGCGQAQFAEQAIQRGWDVRTIDPGKVPREICKKKGIGMIQFEQISEFNPDVVTMWHVIEHIENPKSYLEELYMQLKPGALLVMETPNKDCLNARRNWDTWWYNQKEHLFYFNLPIMRKMMRSTGFDVVEIKSAGGFLVNQQQGVVETVNKYYNLFKPLKSIYYFVAQTLRLSDCMRVVARK